ncbi:unnamed protein product [Blepharisma stoltei]|uniref:EF-hand domain-containing protein n=1 Tax=Blepharisma stoltei TaxID=1481888 RepID=A0AAU9IQ30_9CILI|nr:unnamed protein product [Blepharisma stoltei]
MATDYQKLNNDTQALQKAIRPAFQEVDKNNLGFIDDQTVTQAVTKASQILKISPPSKDQIRIALPNNRTRKGKINFDEFTGLIKQFLPKIGNSEEAKIAPQQLKQEEIKNPIPETALENENTIKNAVNIIEDPRNSAEYQAIESIRRLIANDQLLASTVRGSFIEIDTKNTGFINEKDLNGAVIKATNNLSCSSLKQDQIGQIVKSMSRSANGKVSFQEFTNILKAVLRNNIEEFEKNQSMNELRVVSGPRETRRELFEKYLDDSGISIAFQIIYSEIIAKNIDPMHVFSYSAMRLRELGRELENVLPRNFT